MRPFVCPKLVTVPGDVSSIAEQDSNKSCAPHLRDIADNIPTFRLAPVGKTPEEFRVDVSSWKKTRAGSPRTVTRLNREISNSDTCGHHFLFDKTWRNGMFSKNTFRDGKFIKPRSILPPVSLDFQNHRLHNLCKLTHQKEMFYGNTKPCSFGSYEKNDLTSVPSVQLSVTAPPIVGRNNVSGGFKNRPKVNKRRCNRFTTGSNTSSISYPDPVPGAPVSFTQRLLEISSLEGETVQEEKIKNPKRNRRQES